MVLPYINMNPPQVYMCSPSWTLLPPPSLYQPSGSSQCTSPKHPVSLLFNMLWKQWHPTPVLLPGKSHGRRSLVGYSPWGRSESDRTELLHFHFHALETHSSVLAWRILGTAEPGGLPSMGSHGVGHDWSDLVAAAAFTEQKFLIFMNSSLSTFYLMDHTWWTV